MIASESSSLFDNRSKTVAASCANEPETESPLFTVGYRNRNGCSSSLNASLSNATAWVLVTGRWSRSKDLRLGSPRGKKMAKFEHSSRINGVKIGLHLLFTLVINGDHLRIGAANFCRIRASQIDCWSSTSGKLLDAVRAHFRLRASSSHADFCSMLQTKYFFEV